ncbi:transmembrane 9 superfamily member 5-like [Quercus lobata]|nr:transmembrane 9 superfamily member 5-like [Quercus lobata]
MADTGFLVLVLVALSTLAFATVWTQRNAPSTEEYKEGDYIPLFASTASPYLGDPCEAYSYFDLPFCSPGDPIPNRKKSFQELLAGDCYVNTQYELRFKMGTTRKLLCEKNLTREEVAKFRDAIANNTVYFMYYDNIHLSEYVGGDSSQSLYPKNGDNGRRYFLINHLHFYPQYKRNKVKEIDVLGDYESAVDITEDTEIKVNFTYSVFWEEYESKRENPSRVRDYLKELFKITNRGRAILFLEQVGGANPSPYATAIAIYIWLLLLYIKIVLYLREYFDRISFVYGHVLVEATRATGVIRPRHVHSNACRCPRYSSLLGAILGVGTQLFIMICVLFVLAYTGHLYPCNHERLFIWLIVSYGLTSWFSGYKAASFHSSFTPLGLKECIYQTGALYSGPVFLTGLAIITLKAFTTGVSLLLEIYTPAICFLSLLVTVRFLTWGGMSGHSSPQEFRITCSTIRFQSEIPNQAWYMKTPAQMFFGGILPFICIFYMMDDIYASLYNLKVCGAFRTMLKAFIIIIIVTVLMGMGCTRYQLYKKDHQWWWRSVLRGGSLAIFMFAYGLYFYARASARISMNLLEFLGYNACIFYAVFLILGTIGYNASSIMFRQVDLDLKKRA